MEFLVLAALVVLALSLISARKRIRGLDLRLSELEKRDYLTEIWTSAETMWRAFFRHKQRSFLHEVNLAIERVLYPELFKTTPPEVVNDPLVLECQSLYELRRASPARWHELTESVYRAARRTDGSYVCAVSGFSSKDRHRFEIDHIVPMSEGGRSVPENLRLLERKVNRVLGAALVKQNAAKDG